MLCHVCHVIMRHSLEIAGQEIESRAA